MSRLKSCAAVFVLLGVTGFLLAQRGASQSSAPVAPQQSPLAAPTFYRDVLPILQRHCQTCHRPGEIGPVPLVTYDDARRKARAIADKVSAKEMPPWFVDSKFAESNFGRFSSDPSLLPQEVETLNSWANAGTPPGDPHDAPPLRHWTAGWNIPEPDVIVKMARPVSLPADGDIEYTYEIVPTGFAEGKWVQVSEIRPSSRPNVHHAVVYIRPPDSKWLRRAPIGAPFTASDMTDEESRRDAHWTDADILLVYAPGSAPDNWPADMAKFIPAGSDLVFQMHYMAHGVETSDQSSIGIVFAKQPPKQRVLTLQLTNDHFVIPPGADDYRVEARGSLPNDATVLSFLPHMHLRGKRFEYNIVQRGGRIDTLLRVNWNFYWQLSYRLAEPRALKAGTELQAVAWYDNSKNNPHNPDPDAAVRWGDQTYDEMMVGFFDVAVPADLDKWRYFIRANRTQ
jgi:hypothetical protein